MKKVSSELIARAGAMLAGGGTVVFPTETLYGLAASVLDASAVRKVYAIKRRSLEKQLPVIVGSFAQARKFFLFSRAELSLARRYWPGPLAIVLKARSRRVALAVGGDRVAVRWSADPVAARLAILTGAPIIATSANLSGKPGCFTVRAVKRQLGGSARRAARAVARRAVAGPDMYLDAGTLTRSLPSTIVRVRRGRVEVLREGKISLEMISLEK